MAKNLRVHELAKELGLTNKEAVDLCLNMGIDIKGHSSSIIEAQADRVRRRAERDGLVRDEQPEEVKPVKKAAVKKVAAKKEGDAEGDEPKPAKKAAAKKVAAKKPAKKAAAKKKPAKKAAKKPAAPAAPAAQTDAPDPAADMPLVKFARPFTNAAGKPLFAVVLKDSGAADLDRAALAALPFPISFVLNPMDSTASDAEKIYRAGGQEVVMLATGIPKGANASDLEQSFAGLDGAVPEAVALIDTGPMGMRRRQRKGRRPIAHPVKRHALMPAKGAIFGSLGRFGIGLSKTGLFCGAHLGKAVAVDHIAFCSFPLFTSAPEKS